MDLQVYTVKGSPILHDGLRYEIGARITLTKAEAAGLEIYLQAAEQGGQADKGAAGKEAAADKDAAEEKPARGKGKA